MTLVVASLFACSVATFVLCCASLACMAPAPAAFNYIAFRFLIIVLIIQFPYYIASLLHDFATVIFHMPLPGYRMSTMIVIFEWILSIMVLAASSSTLSVQVYMDKDTGACMLMQPQACRRYKEAAMLGLLLFVFSYAIALLRFFLLCFRHDQAHGQGQLGTDSC